MREVLLHLSPWIRSFLAFVGVVSLSLAVVIALFYFTSITQTFEPSGLPREMPAIGVAYVKTVVFIYGPMSSLVATAFDRLPVMGLLVSFGSILSAVTLQNLLMWFGGKLLVERLRKVIP